MKEGSPPVWWPQQPTECGQLTPLPSRPGGVEEAGEAKTCNNVLGGRATPRALQHSVILQSFPMNHRIVAIAVTAAFASGLVVGHFAGPHDLKVSTQGVEKINKPIAGASTAPSNLDIPQASSVEVSA